MQRAHCDLQFGTELHQELKAICQSPKDTSQDLIISALDLRQQALVTSKAERGVVK